ncbi:hypothetical protein GCM10010331_77300 [Streptomyces xanthochromogenes]|nr:hypothetical protein GCM10010331_77300 [Streptomyces xanthochromogenes]
MHSEPHRSSADQGCGVRREGHSELASLQSRLAMDGGAGRRFTAGRTARASDSGRVGVSGMVRIVNPACREV